MSEVRINSKSYEGTLVSDKWVLTHQLIAEQKYGKDFYKQRADDVGKGQIAIHHADFNKRNNLSENLIRMTWEAHQELHLLQWCRTVGRLHSDPAWVEKWKGALRAYAQTPQGHLHLARAGSLNRAGEIWQDPVFAAHRRAALSDQSRRKWADPKHREKMLRIASERARRQCSDPSFRERRIAAIVAGKKHLSREGV